MTDHRFDAILTAVARARSRREWLAAFTASALLAPAPSAPAAAVCRGRNEKCKQKRECCSGRCRSRKGSRKRRKCACSPEGERCLEVSDCCEGDIRLFCVAGRCVRDR